jgi:hypothetical protein
LKTPCNQKIIVIPSLVHVPNNNPHKQLSFPFSSFL